MTERAATDREQERSGGPLSEGTATAGGWDQVIGLFYNLFGD
jgi:hypothetical protein